MRPDRPVRCGHGVGATLLPHGLCYLPGAQKHLPAELRLFACSLVPLARVEGAGDRPSTPNPAPSEFVHTAADAGREKEREKYWNDGEVRTLGFQLPLFCNRPWVYSDPGDTGWGAQRRPRGSDGSRASCVGCWRESTEKRKRRWTCSPALAAVSEATSRAQARRTELRPRIPVTSARRAGRICSGGVLHYRT